MARPIVVLAEDDVVTRRCVAAVLKPDYEVLEAENGAEAIHLIEQEREQVEAVITDLEMPVMDGWAVLTKVAELGLLCRLIVVSGEIDLTDPRWRQYPQVIVCSKPVNPWWVKRWLAQPGDDLLTVGQWLREDDPTCLRTIQMYRFSQTSFDR